jgi:hypothetical protein
MRLAEHCRPSSVQFLVFRWMPQKAEQMMNMDGDGSHEPTMGKTLIAGASAHSEILIL